MTHAPTYLWVISVVWVFIHILIGSIHIGIEPGTRHFLKSTTTVLFDCIVLYVLFSHSPF